MQKPQRMDWGAIALLDCLGFKGIWKRHEASVVVKRFQELQQGVSDVVEKFVAESKVLAFPNQDDLTVRTAMFSDTIVISARSKNPDLSDQEKGRLVLLTSLIASEACKSFSFGDPTILLRGSIACGQHLMEGSTVIGPAVDEAAEEMNLGDGPFVCFRAECATHYLKILGFTILAHRELGATEFEKTSGMNATDLVELFSKTAFYYEVPVKNSDAVTRLVLNPAPGITSDVGCKMLAKYWLMTMPEADLTLAAKRKNTSEFALSIGDNVREFRNVLSLMDGIAHQSNLGKSNTL